MQLTVTPNGLQQLRAQLAGFSDRRLSAAIATAMTRTAKEASKQWQAEINQQIDRPTARTQNAVTFTGAQADRLSARVFLKDRLSGTTPAEYLQPQEWGGSRSVKKFERALIASGAMPAGYITVPGEGAARDANGNVSRAQLIAVLNQLGRDFTPGYQRTISKAASKRLATAAKHGRRYIVVKPGARISAGIYERQADRRLTMVLAFKRDVHYSRRLRLTDEQRIDVRSIFDVEFERAVDQHIARLAAAK